MYTGTAEVLRNIFIPLLESFGNCLEILQLGLHHTSAVIEAPWPIVPTKAKSSGSNASRQDLADLHGLLSLPSLLDGFQPDLVFLFNDPQIVVDQLRLIRACPHRTKHP